MTTPEVRRQVVADIEQAVAEGARIQRLSGDGHCQYYTTSLEASRPS